MKKLRKVFAVLLTLAMVLGMSMTTFAAPANAKTGSITVSGFKDGVKVYYSQILELDNSGNNWQFANGLTEAQVGMSLEDLTGETKLGQVGKGINENLKGLKLSELSYATATEEIAEDGSITFSGLPAGLYAIKAVDPTNEYIYNNMVVALEYDGNAIANVTDATAKGQLNQGSKVVKEGKKSVSYGETVGYTVTAAYPYVTTQNASFEIQDTVNYGEIKSVTVSVDGATGENSDHGLTYVIEGKKTLKVTLDLSKYKAALAGNSITIDYEVETEATQTIDTLTNEVTTTINVGNGPSATKAVVILPTVSATITKVDENGAAIKNNSATFKLYEKVANAIEGKTTVIKDETGADINVIERVAEATTNEEGVVTFTGLDAEKNGVYYVKETKAPEGFSVEEKAYPLTGASIGEAKTDKANPVIKEDGTIETPRTETTTYQNPENFKAVMNGGMNFTNSNLASLPETGGIGTTIFTIGGCAIMVIAAALFFASRRKSAK